MRSHGIYYEEFPFSIYCFNTQDPQKGVKPTKEDPTVGINTGKLFVIVYRDFTPLADF